MDFTTMLHVLFLGLIVFGARVIDVSLGTLRTINIIYGRAKIAFILGFLETFVWVYVIATILKYIAQYPVLGVFYALGFATGNVVGVAIEKKLAFGYMLLRVIAMESADTMASSLRDEGYRVTTFAGEGRDGPVTMLYIVCQRCDLGDLIDRVKVISPNAFYMAEQAGSLSHILRPVSQPTTSWRSILKKK